MTGNDPGARGMSLWLKFRGETVHLEASYRLLSMVLSLLEVAFFLQAANTLDYPDQPLQGKAGSKMPEVTKQDTTLRYTC